MGFFKPTKAKIYITVLLITIPFVLDMLISFVPILSIIQAPFSSLDDFLFNLLSPPISFLGSYIFLGFYLLVRYLISCILVFLYHKLKS
jgi:hypothetical protein